MSTNASELENRTDLDDRDVRALTECMTVLDAETPGFYTVTTESGREYSVDARGGSCSCPDAEYRDPEGGCKHVRRARIASGRCALPEWVDQDAVDPQLGEHVDGPVATDGGVATADDQAGSAGDQDDECECEECAKLDDGWECADCYISGGDD